MVSYPYIIIEGNIGAGKTSLAKKLAADFSCPAMLEQFEDNSFLPKFYADQKRYAFPLELSFLAARFNQLKELLQSNNEIFRASEIVADYGFFKNLVFARITLDDDEFKLFFKLYEIINPQLPKADLIVYIHQPISRLLTNIHIRGRSYEQEIKPDYLEKIEQGYFDVFKQMQDSRIVIINAENMDFVKNDRDYKSIKSAISSQHPEGISRPVM